MEDGPKNKGKISRVVAAKTSPSARMGALGDTDGVTIGADHYAKVEGRLRELEGGAVRSLSGNGKASAASTQKKVAVAAYGAGDGKPQRLPTWMTGELFRLLYADGEGQGVAGQRMDETAACARHAHAVDPHCLVVGGEIPSADHRQNAGFAAQNLAL